MSKVTIDKKIILTSLVVSLLVVIISFLGTYIIVPCSWDGAMVSINSFAITGQSCQFLLETELFYSLFVGISTFILCILFFENKQK